MGSDGKLFIRIDDGEVDGLRAAIAANGSAAERVGSWLELTPADRSFGAELSRELGARGNSPFIRLCTTVNSW